MIERGGEGRSYMARLNRIVALHIAAHCLQRDPQGVGKLFHRGGFARTHFFKQLELAGVGVHGGGAGCVGCHRLVTNLKYLIGASMERSRL